MSWPRKFGRQKPSDTSADRNSRVKQKRDRKKSEDQRVIVPQPVVLMQDKQEHNKAPDDHFHERNLYEAWIREVTVQDGVHGRC